MGDSFTGQKTQPTASKYWIKRLYKRKPGKRKQHKTQQYNNRLRPIPVLGIGIGPIPAVLGGIGYRRYCSRYRPIPVGRRCNDKMPKYHVDRLISLPAAMAANGVDSSIHNQPCAIMLFSVHGLLQRPPTTSDNHGTTRRPQAKFQEIRRTQQTLSRMRSDRTRRDSDWTRGRQRCVNVWSFKAIRRCIHERFGLSDVATSLVVIRLPQCWLDPATKVIFQMTSLRQHVITWHVCTLFLYQDRHYRQQQQQRRRSAKWLKAYFKTRVLRLL